MVLVIQLLLFFKMAVTQSRELGLAVGVRSEGRGAMGRRHLRRLAYALRERKGA